MNTKSSLVDLTAKIYTCIMTDNVAQLRDNISENSLTRDTIIDILYTNMNNIIILAARYCNETTLRFLIDEVYRGMITKNLLYEIVLYVNGPAVDYIKSVIDSADDQPSDHKYEVVGSLSFKDNNGVECSLQKSSESPTILVGVDKMMPKVQLSSISEFTGWADYPLPDCVKVSGHMELTREQIAELLPYLIHFSIYGELARPIKSPDTNRVDALKKMDEMFKHNPI